MTERNDKDQKTTGSDKLQWIEPEVIQVDQLPVTFSLCVKGASVTPGDDPALCRMGKRAGLRCVKGAGGAKA